MKKKNKTMKLLTISIFLFISIKILSQNDTVFNINGTTTIVKDGDYIMLFSFKGNEIAFVDTAIVKNGTFELNGKEYLNDLSILTSGNYPNPTINTYVALEKGNIHVDFGKKSRVSGTYLNELYQLYSDSCNYYEKKLEQLLKQQKEDKKHGIVDEKLSMDISDEFNKMNKFSGEFKKRNIRNIVGKWAFLQGLNFSGDPFFYEIYTLADEEFKCNIEVKESFNKRKKYDQLEAERKHSIGNVYIDFTFQTQEGETKKLSDYVGKSEYLFIDFWASWCGPCIADIPNLKKVYDEYRDKGLEIISISLDDTQSAWEKGLSKINASWIHLCDFGGSRSKLTETYGIYGIPYGILLNKEGYIVNVNLGGESLGILLQNMMKKK